MRIQSIAGNELELEFDNYGALYFIDLESGRGIGMDANRVKALVHFLQEKLEAV